MDELQVLLDRAKKAKAEGFSDKDIAYQIYAATNGAYQSISDLTRAIAAADDPHRGFKGFARAVGEGATFSLWDEAMGVLYAAIPGGKGYREARDISRGRYEPYREDHPRLALAGEIAGGAVPALLTAGGGAALGAGAAGARAGAGLGTRVAGGLIGGAMGGAGAGALTGAGMAEEMSDVPMEALAGGIGGAAVGGALGAAAPLAGAVAKPLAQRVGAVVAPEATARWISRDMLRKAYRATGMSEQEIIDAMRRMPEGSVVADLDPALAREARAAVNQAPGLERAGGSYEAVGRRHAGRGQRIADELQRGRRSLRTGSEMMQETQALVEKARKEGYDVLEAEWTGQSGRNLRDIIEADPDLMAVIEDIMPGFKEGRGIGFREAQDILIDARKQASALAEYPARGRRLLEASKRIENALEEVAPGFSDVQAQYAQALRMDAAYPVGLRSWSKGLSELRLLTKEMNPHELEAFRIGMLDKVEDALRQSEAGNPIASQLMRGMDLGERLRATFRSDEAFEAFMNVLEREGRWQLTWNKISGGSTTAKQSNDLLQGGLSLRGIASEIFDPGQVREQAAQAAGQQLLSPPAPGFTPDIESNKFLQILQMANPILRGSAPGAAAPRAQQGLLGEQVPF